MRTTTAISLLAALPLAWAQNIASTSPRRGLVYVQTQHGNDNAFWEDSDLTWYYNYKAEPESALDHSSLQFVPMLWGAGESADTFYTTVKGLLDGGMNITYALGFNEPDACSSGGSCVDAATAAETWVSQMQPLRALGVKLGAPATTGAPNGFIWLQNFFTQCAGRCTPDFMPAHYYGDFEGLASHVGQLNATYANVSATWVTEYGFPNQSLADTQAYYNETTAFLDRVPYISRYSYFGAFRSDVSNVGPDAAMLTQDGELTDIGAWYLGRAPTGNVPMAGDAAQVAGFAGWAFVVLAVSFCLLG